MRTLRSRETRLLIVGSFDHDPGYRRLLLERFGDLIVLVGPRPHSEMPLFLSIASIVALPQQRSRETEAQVPGKVFEAMAMGCPILATAVSDLPEILEGCGLVVPPGDPKTLGSGLRTLLGDRELRARLGAQARRRCEERFSWDAMQSVLDREFDLVVR
jgi:glycosyltransferase involved in cell wall biosynthesis